MKTKKAEDGTQIPAIGLGTFGIGGGMTADTSRDSKHVEALRKAFELGYSHIDTAEVYADGHCEEMVGKAIEGYPREQFFITTKVDPSHLHYDDVHTALEGSLNRLGVDYVDLYLIHWPNSSIPLSESFRGLNALVKQGTVRHLGVSNFSVEQLEEARRHSGSAVVTNQVPYGLHDRTYDENGMLAYCQKNGVLLTAYSPIKKASLTDPTVKEIAKEKRATPAQIALAWLVAQPQVITIPKAADPAHLAENWKALDIELSDKDMERLSALS